MRAEGQHINDEFFANEAELLQAAEQRAAASSDAEDILFWDLIKSWLSDKAHIEVQTSGSTGAPKIIKLPKAWMRRSAEATGAYLGLKAGMHAYLCISPRHVGGMMMIVRALHLGMDLIWDKASRHPQLEARVDFTAMVPMQVEALVEGKEDLSKFGRIIIGGAPISQRLELSLETMPGHFFATYGMSETASHVAIREIAPHSGGVFSAMPGITCATDAEGCLQLKVPYFDELEIQTTDIVQLIDEGHFIWLGRADHIINSGGLKFNPEQIEAQLSMCFDCDFFIYKEADEHLGQRVVLCLESLDEDLETIQAAIARIEPKTARPKVVYGIGEFSRSPSGKVIREQSFAQAKRRLI